MLHSLYKRQNGFWHDVLSVELESTGSVLHELFQSLVRHIYAVFSMLCRMPVVFACLTAHITTLAVVTAKRILN